MPRQVAVQLARSVVALQPVLDEADAAGRIAGLEEAMDALVGRMRIVQVAGERSLDQSDSLRNLTCLDVGPAEITEKPPVVTLARRQLLEQRQLSSRTSAPGHADSSRSTAAA